VSLRCGAELDLLHHRSCDRWLWCRWHIARHIEHRGQFCSEEKGATVLWLCSWNPRRKCVFGTYLWRHFRRSCELALVFLDVGNLADHTRVFVDKLRSNLPLGAIALVVIPWLVRNRHAENSARAPTFFTRLRRVDWLGTSFFLSSFVCLFLALQWGGQTMPWKSATIIGLFVGFIVLLGVFAVTQRYMEEESLIPIRFLKQRTVLSGTIYLVFLGLQMAIVGCPDGSSHYTVRHN
jgi:hypothetical protein